MAAHSAVPPSRVSLVKALGAMQGRSGAQPPFHDYRQAASRAMSLASDILPPVLTAGVAVGGLLQAGKQARHTYSAERDAARAAEADAARQRFDARFAQAVENLGADNAMRRAAGAALVQAMAQTQEAELADQAMALLIGALQLDQDHGCRHQLVAVLEQSLRRRGERRTAGERDGEPVNLARIRTPGINLTSVDLGPIDLAFADLSRASLAQATLSRSRGFGVRLTGATLNQAMLREVKWHCVDACGARFKWATLTSAELRRGDFRGADFFQARLQSAHFDGADLRGARFDGAVLTDTYLRGAQLDDVALTSILRSRDWRDAILDRDTFGELLALNEGVGVER